MPLIRIWFGLFRKERGSENVVVCAAMAAFGDFFGQVGGTMKLGQPFLSVQVAGGAAILCFWLVKEQ